MCSPSASVSPAPASAGGLPFRMASCPNWTDLYGVFARLERPIPFDAFDNRPVDLVFALLAPADAGAEHLRALARVSRAAARRCDPPEIARRRQSRRPLRPADRPQRNPRLVGRVFGSRPAARPLRSLSDTVSAVRVRAQRIRALIATNTCKSFRHSAEIPPEWNSLGRKLNSVFFNHFYVRPSLGARQMVATFRPGCRIILQTHNCRLRQTVLLYCYRRNFFDWHEFCLSRMSRLARRLD